MPGLDGFALQSRLSVTGQALPIVFLTGRGDVPLSVRAMKAGAADFLTKPVASATLIAAVRNAIAQDDAVQRTQGDATALTRRFESLTPREREVLAALVGGKLGKQIADELGVVEQTVKFHRARIMKRMQARTLAELMYMAARLDFAMRSVKPTGWPWVARDDQP
jgi:FixJ family two-component response regulator